MASNQLFGIWNDKEKTGFEKYVNNAKWYKVHGIASIESGRKSPQKTTRQRESSIGNWEIEQKSALSVKEPKQIPP